MSDTAAGFADWIINVQTRTERALEHFLPASVLAPQRLHEAMRYAVLGGGKRVRPLLAHAAGEFASAPPEAIDAAACAVELIHAYSLVHDDMPCMDDDVLRRGKPTVHVHYDDATALLVGDSLQSLAFHLLAEHCPVAPERRVTMVNQLAIASGSRGMAGGQAIDLASVGVALGVHELEYMHIHKTGALIRCAIRLGYHCGEIEVDAAARLDHYAATVGLLFQVVDDVLDCEASTEALGKTAGKDAAANKPTYVSTLGLTGARERARELHAEALDSLSSLGAPARRLRELADFVLTRKH
ncbi:polyprenyl synthetase family protein [Methyloversatilis thermotolerans]|uniref:polyprenyl synthetase family protein n=1 Tax=Methyloversatilis thermotolerans TaxID=1346290 RepID=UPI000362A925|nr:farnesyl diphosphate synthase [Methyloversatilis thermotolerans]